MNVAFKFAALVLAAGLTAASARAQECASTPQINAVAIVNEAGGRLVDVAGDQSFYQALDNGWMFGLVKHPSGWSVRVYDGPDTGNATDLTSLTPPHGGASNPRDILGWHFRNAANTGPNTGDVNAPQLLRAFVISPGLAGTGGYKPSTDPDEPRLMEPGPDDGIGWLKVMDFGLTDLGPGQQAKMNFLRFEACLSWPKSEAQQAVEQDAASLEFTALEKGLFEACGLDPEFYALAARYPPRRLTLDMDASDASDVAAQIMRLSDGARGIAICRNGSELELAGFDGPDGLRPGYLDQAEAWTGVAAGAELPRHLQGFDLPPAQGGHLIIERIEKEAVTLFWTAEGLSAEQVYRFVEP